MESADFIDLVTRRGLADAGPLWQYLADNGGARGLPADASELAGQFVAAGLLTPLQAELALAGQAASLTVGPYLLVERLGGQAYLGRRRQGGRVAVLKPARRGVPPALPGHPNLLQAQALDAAGWMVMEQAPGRPLSELGRLSPVQAARAAACVASALAHLHSAGLVHGRVSAEHVLAGPGGEAVLLHHEARPAGTREDDLAALAGVLRGVLAEAPPPLEALVDRMEEGALTADEVEGLLREWLQVVAPPPLIVPNRRSSAQGMRPAEEEGPAPAEEGPEWWRWALLALGVGVGLAVVVWLWPR